MTVSDHTNTWLFMNWNRKSKTYLSCEQIFAIIDAKAWIDDANSFQTQFLPFYISLILLMQSSTYPKQGCMNQVGCSS